MGYLSNKVEFEQPSGSSSFSVLPLRVGLHSTGQRHEIGVGLAYHMNPKWELCIYGCESVTFDNAMGLYGAYQFYFNASSYLGVRFTELDYEKDGESIDGGSLGLYFGARFQ